MDVESNGSSVEGTLQPTISWAAAVKTTARFSPGDEAASAVTSVALTSWWLITVEYHTHYETRRNRLDLTCFTAIALRAPFTARSAGYYMDKIWMNLMDELVIHWVR